VKTKFVLILVTAPNRPAARRLARAALEARLAACANLVPGIESHYWWQGRMERSGEVLILFKTTQHKVPALEKMILAAHPYDTPEFVVLAVNSGSQRYLAWIGASVEASPRLRRKP
jgi:periplasmic divalent cation tolerance protein